MPKILRVELTSDQEREVRERLRACDLAPGTRLRLECVRLMGRGLIVPEVADLLECNEVTVRGAVRRFAAGGFDALADAHCPGRPIPQHYGARSVAASSSSPNAGSWVTSPLRLLE
ncbi:hypothetical protein GCM10023080_012960 [Streptomyces pseudoechinosporeus]